MIYTLHKANESTPVHELLMQSSQCTSAESIHTMTCYTCNVVIPKWHAARHELQTPIVPEQALYSVCNHRRIPAACAPASRIAGAAAGCQPVGCLYKIVLLQVSSQQQRLRVAQILIT
jgi:hypothetical protein